MHYLCSINKYFRIKLQIFLLVSMYFTCRQTEEPLVQEDKKKCSTTQLQNQYKSLDFIMIITEILQIHLYVIIS